MDYDPLNNFETLLYGTPVDPLVCTPLSEYNSELEDAYRFRSPSSSSSSSSSSLVVSPTTNAGPRPDLPGSIPALVLHKAVAAGLTRAGFDEADPDALDELEGALASFFGSLLLYAHQLAEHARRHVPTVVDVLKGCEDLGIGGVDELLHEARVPLVRVDPGPLLPSDDEHDPLNDDDDDPDLASPPPTPPRLASPPLPTGLSDDSEDDEFEEVTPLGPDGLPLAGHHQSEAIAAKEKKKREKRQMREEALEKKRRERQEIEAKREREKAARDQERERRRRERKRRQEADPLRADWLPALPPKHSWKQTPVYPESAAPPPIPPPISQTQQAPSAAAMQHLSTLRARLNDSQLVAASLRNLIRKTRASAVGEHHHHSQQQQQQQQQQDSADVVDYESEWYGARGLGAATGSKRKIRVVTIGQRTNKSPGDLLQLESEASAAAGGGDGSMMMRKGGGMEGGGEGSRVGGAVKRRRWLV
ncbi:hypothetical protein C6P46_004897 [Rhodotorula mucilaginosa]|uniref:Transcription initiation factor TFIID subunit 8 n=1 Tax=Rhodotorula mucilaginosa TaxID=5537 RepID=A0A9P6W7U5_RHOMI|nr:hypothetical protein C6P46_004897 [Rhodotorula mucilaginosa]